MSVCVCVCVCVFEAHLMSSEAMNLPCFNRYRILRHTCTLKVRDSLQVRASAVHSYMPANGLTNQ